jgi:hypothetical protein
MGSVLGGLLTTYTLPAAWQMGSEVLAYRRDPDVIDLRTIRRTPKPAGPGDLLNDQNIRARSDEFSAIVSDLVIDGIETLPQPYDEIEWTDELGQPTVSVVFPRHGEECFDFTDPDGRTVRIYAYRKAEMTELLIQPVGEAFLVDAVMTTPQLSQEEDIRTGFVYGRMSAMAYIGRNQVPEWMTEPHREMTITEIHGVEAGPEWSLDLNTTRWGQRRVALGLVTAPLLAQGELRRGQ